MLLVDPFKYLARGLAASINVGDGVSLELRVDEVAADRRRVWLAQAGDAPDAVEFADWRVYMVSLVDPTSGSDLVEVVVPTELRAVSRRPLRLELEVLDGTAVIQRRVLYRTTRPGVRARVRFDGSDRPVNGDVLDLSVSGLALSTFMRPPPVDTALAVDLLLPSGPPLALAARLAEATAVGDSDWRWTLLFDPLAPAVLDALKLYIHRAGP